MLLLIYNYEVSMKIFDKLEDMDVDVYTSLQLTDEQMEKYSDITDYYNYDGYELLESFSYSYVDYYEDCKKLKNN